MEPCRLHLEIGHELSQLLQRTAVERVVDPSAIPAVRDQASFLEDLQVEREAGLRGIQRIGEITDTLLAPSEEGDEAKSSLVAQRREPAPDLREITRHRSHGESISRDVDASRAAALSSRGRRIFMQPHLYALAAALRRPCR